MEIIAILAIGFLALQIGKSMTNASQIPAVLPPPTASTPLSAQLSTQNAAAVTEECAPPPAQVASELTAITGIETTDSTVAFDTLPGAGAVTIGGAPATTGYNPSGGMGTDADAATASKLAATAVGMVGAAGAALSGGAAAFAATAIGSAIPFIGIAIGIVSTVIGMISQHHAIALANEGKVLNTTDPNAFAAFVLVIQAVINGEISTAEEAQTYLTTIVNDWYGQVSGIIRGKWSYVGSQFPEPTYADSYASRTGPYGSSSTNPDSHAPDTCNAACVIGHYFIERGAMIALAAVKDILSGNHNIATFPVLPPHDTQSGVPQIQVMY
jgi:hypothetical protein